MFDSYTDFISMKGIWGYIMERMMQNDTKPAAPKIHPLMEPEKVKEIWRVAQKRWTHDSEAMVREIGAERDNWDRRVP